MQTLLAYDDATTYRKGDSIIVGTGADVIVWTAGEDIVAGGGEPSLIFQLNWLQSAIVGAWKGDVLTNYPRTLNAGDWYRVGDDEIYLVKAYQERRDWDASYIWLKHHQSHGFKRWRHNRRHHGQQQRPCRRL